MLALVIARYTLPIHLECLPGQTFGDLGGSDDDFRSGMPERVCPVTWAREIGKYTEGALEHNVHADTGAPVALPFAAGLGVAAVHLGSPRLRDPHPR